MSHVRTKERDYIYRQFRYLYGTVPNWVYKLDDVKLRKAWEEEAKMQNAAYLGKI